MKSQTDRILIGWTEFVDLPEWNVRKLRAKIDTGARSSALHVEGITELPRGRVRFDIILHRKKRDRRIHVVAKVQRRSRVRSSNGSTETRYFVRTRLRLGPIEQDVELSLVDRGKMIHRMLLGRSALAGPILIDVNHRMLQSPKKKKKKKKKKSEKKPTKKKTSGANSPHG